MHPISLVTLPDIFAYAGAGLRIAAMRLGWRLPSYAGGLVGRGAVDPGSAQA